MDKDILYQMCLDHANAKIKTTSWKEICENAQFDGSSNALRKWFSREFVRRNNGVATENPSVVPTQTSNKETIRFVGDVITSEKVVELRPEQLTEPDAVLEANGYDPKKFTLTAMTVTSWDGGDSKKYACKVSVKPKEQQSQITIEDVDKWFDSYAFDERKQSKYSYGVSEGYTLEIDLPDVHLGNMGLDNNGFKKTVDNFYQTIDELYARVKDEPIKKVIIAVLGDYLHFDNSNRTTTSGTLLDSSVGDYKSVFETGVEMMVYAVERFVYIAPVDVVVVYGNHDHTMSYFLSKVLQVYYRNRSDVSVDSSNLPRKTRVIGSTLVGWFHGDMNKNNIISWIQSDCRKEFGQTKRTFIRAGHFHTERMEEHSGMLVHYLPALSVTDSWSYKNGFVGSKKALTAFLWDDDRGLMNTIYIPIEE